MSVEQGGDAKKVMKDFVEQASTKEKVPAQRRLPGALHSTDQKGKKILFNTLRMKSPTEK